MLLAVTSAPLPIADALVRLLTDALDDWPKKVLLLPEVLVVPVDRPNAVLPEPVVAESAE